MIFYHTRFKVQKLHQQLEMSVRTSHNIEKNEQNDHLKHQNFWGHKKFDFLGLIILIFLCFMFSTRDSTIIK